MEKEGNADISNSSAPELSQSPANIREYLEMHLIIPTMPVIALLLTACGAPVTCNIGKVPFAPGTVPAYPPLEMSSPLPERVQADHQLCKGVVFPPKTGDTADME